MLINTERMAFLAMNSFYKYRELFFSTFKLSACTFGGGFVIIPLMRKKFVEELGWIEEDEMLDLIAIAQSSPGAIAVNASILVGYHVAGFLGAMLTVLGTVLPPLIIISIHKFRLIFSLYMKPKWTAQVCAAHFIQVNYWPNSIFIIRYFSIFSLLITISGHPIEPGPTSYLL